MLAYLKIYLWFVCGFIIMVNLFYLFDVFLFNEISFDIYDLLIANGIVFGAVTVSFILAITVIGFGIYIRDCYIKLKH